MNMNKIKTLFIALCAIALTGCGEENSENIDNKPMSNSLNIRRGYFDNHSYIIYSGYNAGGIMTIEAENVIRFISERYCIVEKSKLYKLDIAFRAKHYDVVVLNPSEVKGLFPELFKE